MSTANTAVASAVRAVVIPDNGMFACIIDKARIGTSKHKDYFEYHFRRGDIKALTQHKIGEFVYMNADGTVESVVDATKAKKRGGSQKAAAPADKTDTKPVQDDSALIAMAEAGLAAADTKAADGETDEKIDAPKAAE